MLLLTDNAIAVIKQIGDQPTQPEGVGLRISVNVADPAAMRVDATTGPDPDDQVVERDGGRVFLEPAAAELLSDRILDARIGAEGSVEFLLAPQ